jgi:hypothetical protein
MICHLQAKEENQWCDSESKDLIMAELTMQVLVQRPKNQKCLCEGQS